jgi:RNase P subunit RPR2
MKNDGFCRGCDKPLKRNEDMALKMYSHRNRGQHIILCPKCVEDAYRMMVDFHWDEAIKKHGEIIEEQ